MAATLVASSGAGPTCHSAAGLRTTVECTSCSAAAIPPSDPRFPSVQAELLVQPGRPVVRAHGHPEQEERLVVLEGRTDGISVESGTAGPGQTLVYPPGVPHSRWNAGDTPMPGAVSPLCPQVMPQSIEGWRRIPSAATAIRSR